MDETEFWELIDSTREAAGGDPDRHADLLVDRLTDLDPQTVVDFARHFESRFARAYRWDLWGAAWVLLNGASDDCFENFRCWLISRGRRVFEGALHDPDALAELLTAFDPETDGEAEEVGFAAYDAHEQLTGEELPSLGLPVVPPEPLGTPLDFEEERELARAYPRLWARFRTEGAPDGPPRGEGNGRTGGEPVGDAMGGKPGRMSGAA
ncbi:DUF4240 domain-containing protein [Streptomyces calidiresistens]|uniref:DUF4240 domain-containing protein n=1 Tax=Streptomyces calidiresistens TaxID=1485586 RepID=A0A7W3T522_9ACTN|nr:DUF4240 domain-containing protein [Streptomyces calidiresistens]